MIPVSVRGPESPLRKSSNHRRLLPNRYKLNSHIPCNDACPVVSFATACAMGTVSATAPFNQQDFDTPTTYTNYGKSAIWVAAPGGDFAAGTALDGILSTYPGGWAWATGTSQAAPVVAGVAALILEKYGPMSVGDLKNHIAQTADDLGKPGKDEWYGRGRVNAYKAVTK